mmetsp:Transcript_39009/g.108371  ORF Transcript_39009/g.108371 Transcript_39009/m.108371 type:complete len:200 (+) Transcript_39009:541-1140(+)
MRGTCPMGIQPEDRKAATRSPGRPRSAFTGIHRKIISMARSSHATPTAGVAEPSDGTRDDGDEDCSVRTDAGRLPGGVEAEANMQRYRCQKPTTIDVQIGSISQQALTSSRNLPTGVPSAGRPNDAEERTARNAVLPLQLASLAFMSRRTPCIRSRRNLARSSAGLCHNSSCSASPLRQRLWPNSSSPTRTRRPLPRST